MSWADEIQKSMKKKNKTKRQKRVRREKRNRDIALEIEAEQINKISELENQLKIDEELARKLAEEEGFILNEEGLILKESISSSEEEEESDPFDGYIPFVKERHNLIRDELYDGEEGPFEADGYFHQNVGKSVAESYWQSRRRTKRGINKMEQNVSENLDQKSRVTLSKLISSELINSVEYCVATGKESFVFYAKGDYNDYAIKVYKVQTLGFKRRKPYIIGHLRNTISYDSNPQSLAKLWAEKEYRNLIRLNNCNINCPIPELFKENIVVMSFIGINGRAAPRLEDIKSELSIRKLSIIYKEISIIMNKMYNEAKIVHCDLSSYNILYLKKKPFIIDVSQSLSIDADNSIFFLKKDCLTITRFFRSLNVNTLPSQTLFNFIVDKEEEEQEEEQEVSLSKKFDELINKEISEKELLENEENEEGWLAIHTPKSLHDIGEGFLELEEDISRFI